MLYQMQEGYFTLEGEWQDRSINMLTARDLPVTGTNLTVTREPLPPGVEFTDYLRNQKRTLEKELTEFRPSVDTPDTVDGIPAHFLEFSWKHEGNTMHQLVMVANLDGQVLNLTGTIPGTFDKTARNALLSAMRNFRFGTAPAAEGGSPE